VEALRATVETEHPAEPAPEDGWLETLGQWGSSVAESVTDAVDGIREQFAPTQEERAAIEFVRSMLEPDKLGGNDRTFNQNDIDRIVDALLEDPAVQQQIHCGIRQEAFRQAEATGGLLRGIARRIADKRTTPGTRAYAKHYPKYWAQGLQQASERIRGELTDALEAEGFEPVEGQGPSGVQREITLAELERFQRATDRMKAYADRVAEKLGSVDQDMPHGLSQASMDSILGMLPAAKE